MTDRQPAHHPAIDALLAADLSANDLYLLGSAHFAVVGKSQLPGRVPAWGGGRMERWAGAEFRDSLQHFATGVDPDDSET